MLKYDFLHNICPLQSPAVDGTTRLREQHISEKNVFYLGEWGGVSSVNFQFSVFVFET